MNFTNALQIAQVRPQVGGALALLFFAACSGSSSMEDVAPERLDPRTTIDQFMSAVKNDDIAEMSELWGTKDGPAADRMDPVVAERRLRLMQIYLEHDAYEVLLAEGEFLSRDESQSRFQVRLTRRNCQPMVPFTLVQTNRGWLISNVDLAQAGNPARGCPRGAELL